MNKLEQTLLSIYTVRGRTGESSDLEKILPLNQTRFYGYGRQALADAFRRAGVRSGDEVLLPAFLCGEVLGSLAVVGAIPRFYGVNEQLHADVASWDQIGTKNVCAVLAVNYFGFPQPLAQIHGWCRAHSATLIEDNAHGFLSAIKEVPLGRRGDIGVFSLRKTLSLPNGAAVVDNRREPMNGDGLSFRESCRRAEWRYRCKTFLKLMMEVGGLRSARTLVSIIRIARFVSTGSALPASPLDREARIPEEALAPLTLQLLSRCDLSYERQRRRDLYRLCLELLAGEPHVRPIFSDLPDGVVPQGFPFIYTGDDHASFRRIWWQRGVPIISWPEYLPMTVQRDSPEHYRQVMLVQFLW